MDVANVLAAHGVGEAIGNAAVGDVRAGKKFSTTALIGATGTLADNGNGPTVNPSTSTQTLAAGIYNSSITVNPVTGTAAAGDILTGKTASSANGINITGTMPNHSGSTVTPSTTETVVIPAGYYDGTAVVAKAPPTYADGRGSMTSSGTSTSITVSGLSFTPSNLVITIDGGAGFPPSFYNSFYSSANFYDGSSIYSATFSPTSGGFTFTAQLNSNFNNNVYWQAFE